MKKFIAFSSAALSAALISAGTAVAIDTYVPGDAAGGIGSSRHNLGAMGIFTATASTTEVCVFCHTPHHASIENGIRPLWNRFSTAPASYTAYGTTLGGTIAGDMDLGPTTLACLSCHDGVTAFDSIVNAPGKNGVVSGGRDMGWSFYDGTGRVQDHMVSLRLTVGTDLSNDHPVSVPYVERTAGLRPINTKISTIDLTADFDERAFAFDSGNLMRNYWAVKGYISEDALIEDLLREHNGRLRVECPSCHDPHFNNKSWNEIDYTYSVNFAGQERESNGLFLRRVGGNTGSGLCRTCHNK